MEFSVQQAKNQLSKLLELAAHGEKVTITRHGKPVAQLMAIARKKRELGMEARLEPFPVGWEAPMSKKETVDFLNPR